MKRASKKSLGPARYTPEAFVEMRAAELATDPCGIDIPHTMDESDGWLDHAFDFDRHAGRDPRAIDQWWAGWLARQIAEHHYNHVADDSDKKDRS